MRYFIKYEPVAISDTGLIKTEDSRTLCLDPSYSDKVDLSHNDFLNMQLEVSKETFRRVLYNASHYNKALENMLKETLDFQSIHNVTGRLIYTLYGIKENDLVVLNPLTNWNGELDKKPMEWVNVVFNERLDDNFTAEQLEDKDFVLIKTKFSFGSSLIRAYPVIGGRINKNGMHDGIWMKIINYSFKDDFGQEIDMFRTMTRFE